MSIGALITLHTAAGLPVPFERGAAKAYALVRAAVPERRRDALDKLIASHAKSLNLTLVTNNLSDFQVYSDIQLENWCDPIVG